jgi:uncharacterized protein
MIRRPELLRRVEIALKRSPVVAVLGPRQCGKTTLARQLVPADDEAYFDLEDPTVEALLSEPMSVLSRLKGVVVIDEVQRQPRLFPVLRVLADREPSPATFLILGSASPELSRQAAESLAGRVELIEMRGFATGEVDPAAEDALWQRGGFPRSFLAAREEDSFRWRRDFIRTFLERDLANLGFGMSPSALGRFWTMISHYHGQVWNASEIGASMGIAPNTAKHYLDALEQTYMVRRLLPWFENVGKRLVKSPKIYLRDSGIFHALQGIDSAKALWTHPKLGASWEGFVLEELLAAWDVREAYFYSVHSGSELDLFFLHHGKRIGVEIKRSDAPKLTRSMRLVCEDLGLDELRVVYPGTRKYPLADRVWALPFTQAINFAGKAETAEG